MINGDKIATLVINQYNSLPSKGKPLLRSNGVQEWTVLAGIVILNTTNNQLECVSLATGVKASPDNLICNCGGKILHDCHAEILAIRAFNLYVINHGHEQIGAIYMYVSSPPCGDASMGLLNGDESWSKDPEPLPNTLLRGRAHFNRLGHIRTKPGRPDSNMTMSKSCSDKLGMRQCRGIFLCPLRHALGTTRYLDGFICPKPVQISRDFERAFSRWSPVHRFECINTSLTAGPPPPPLKQNSKSLAPPSPCSIIWLPGFIEIIANGVKQGSNKPSRLSRYELAKAAKIKWPEKFVDIKHYLQLKVDNSWPPFWERTAKDDFVI